MTIYNKLNNIILPIKLFFELNDGILVDFVATNVF